VTLDIVFPVWNRVEFTQFAWQCLLDNTDWSLVRKLVVYDDGSEDGADKWIEKARKKCPVESEYRYLGLRSPVETMNNYINTSDADVFAKIDNDITVPPGWLEAMLEALASAPGVELLGMEAGRAPTVDPTARPYWVTEASHIGGVGLMLVDSFKRRTRMTGNGRFGFTEWQHEFMPRRGWITPDLPVVALDRIPFEPWVSYSEAYEEANWQRRWTRYYDDAGYWNWWPPERKP